MGRATRGATVMRMKKSDSVASVALMSPREKKKTQRKAPPPVEVQPSVDGSDGQEPTA
jgi:hypothetical protein